jgi:acetyl esterase/lipase
MPRRLFIFAFALFGCFFVSMPMLTQAASNSSAAIGWSITKDIPYPGAAQGDRRRSLDLYLATKSDRKPPLLIFVHGGFWLLPDDNYRIGPSLAGNLVQDGVAVALARYRLAPANRHPAQADDVAAAVGYLIKHADKYGFDAKRLFLAGHSAGGHLVSLVALDPSYLSRQGLPAKTLAGVISFSGLYDFAPTWKGSENQKQATEKTFGADLAILKQASPIHHVRADAPPFLIMNAFRDFTGFAWDAQRFADALRTAGNKDVQRFTFKGTDHFSLIKLDGENNAVRRTLLAFMGIKAPAE